MCSSGCASVFGVCGGWYLTGVHRHRGDLMTVKRMDNVGIGVEDLGAAIAFFIELGLEL